MNRRYRLTSWIPILSFALASLLVAAVGQTSKPATKSGSSTPRTPAKMSLKQIQAKIVGAWSRLYDGELARDEKGNLIGSVLSFDANNQITFRVDTSSRTRFVFSNTSSYSIEKDSNLGLFVLTGEPDLKFAIVSVDADTLSIRYIGNDGKPVDWVDKWQRISKDPIRQ